MSGVTLVLTRDDGARERVHLPRRVAWRMLWRLLWQRVGP